MKTMKKTLSLFLVTLMLAAVIVGSVPTQAQAAKKTGIYTKTLEKNPNWEYNPTYNVQIHRLTKSAIRFTVSYIGPNASPIYDTGVIKAKYTPGKTITFKWSDTWENSGTGRLRIYDGFVRIKMVQKHTADVNRATLNTKGRYIKLKKSSSH